MSETVLSPSGTFEVLACEGRARAGRFFTGHGAFETPAFMPVGTQGTVKGVTPRELTDLGAEIVLSNSYHLHVRPGERLIAELGGLHSFMGWTGPILTDSGGFQVFSLSSLRKFTDTGVTFRSHVDGALIEFTPERVIEIQQTLGVDIAMVLDECLAYPASAAQALASWKRTLRWAERSLAARTANGMLLFGIAQGGMYEDLRVQSAAELSALPFDGYAIGGLSVGEPTGLMRQMLQASARALPEAKLHYLMGVGTPSDIVEAVSEGIDLFDCVMPTRSARFGRLYTEEGFINIRNQTFRRDPRPVEPNCSCYSCRNFSRAYLAHLIHAQEALFVVLSSIHNLHFYQRLMKDIRNAIKRGGFTEFKDKLLGKRQDSDCTRDINREINRDIEQSGD